MAGHVPVARDLEDFDAVVHLAGENIARRWTEGRKVRIRLSRVRGTRFLAQALAKLSIPPRVMISASAIGYYGDRGEEILSEESSPGEDFLAEVCREWEAATKPAADRGIRVIHLRTGVVLSAKGGALAKMLPAFKMGLAGEIGSGRQYMSWVDADDLVSAILFTLEQGAVRGPVNAVSPNPVTNGDFTTTLGEILHRPTHFRLPAFVVRLLLGEMGVTALLASQRVKPAKLCAAGFAFRYPDLDGALRHALNKPGK